MTQDYNFLESNVNTFSMGGDQPNIKQLLRSSADNSRGTARPNDASKGIPFDGMFWLDSVAREMYIYSISKTGGPGWIRLFEIYDGTMLQAPPNPALQDAWPEGSIFLTADNVNPGVASRLGFGEWTLIGEGRAICCIGQNTTDPSGSYTIGEGDGGSAFVTLAPENLPAHTHPFSVPGVRGRNVGGSPAAQPVNEDGPAFNGVTNVNANAGQPFSNLPPYSPVYIWLRGADPAPTVLGTTSQNSVNLGNLFNQPQCSGGGAPFQGNTPWTGYEASWQDTLSTYENQFWSFALGGQFEVLQTFSFWDVTAGQLVYTFNQGLAIASGVAGTAQENALCIFDLVTDTSCQYHGYNNLVPEIKYVFGASTITPQPPSWWGNEIVVINGTSPP